MCVAQGLTKTAKAFEKEAAFSQGAAKPPERCAMFFSACVRVSPFASAPICECFPFLFGHGASDGGVSLTWQF